MKAATYATYGAPDVVNLVERPKPVPADNEIVVRVNATLVTSGDARMRAFDLPELFKLPGRFMLGWPTPRKPVLGYSYAGTVDSVGKSVTTFAPGDEVLGGHVGGAHAEYNCVPASSAIVAKPASLPFDAAATLAFGPNTALRFLRKAGVGPGTRLLVIGASGSVGAYAVQLAHHMGAEVTAVCSAANAELVTALGATDVIDYRTTDIRKIAGRFDVVFETIGSMAFKDVLPLLSPRGVFATAVMAPSDIWPMLWAPARKGRRIVGGAVR
jgi:NADPH:quinone reductase-like Zn-dependent oxidoreductase